MRFSVNFLTQLFLYLAFCALIALLIWGINRGFDLTDEGYYILGLTHPYDSIPIMEYQKIIAGFTGWFHPGIIGYRAIRLALTLLSSLFFSWAFLKWLKTTILINSGISLKFFQVACFVGIGSLLSYSIYPQTLSYNSITLITCQLFAGCIFYALSVPPKTGRLRLIILFFTGIVSGFQFFVKYPGGFIFIILFVSIFFTVYLIRKQLFRNLIRDIAFFASGLFFMSVYYTFTEQSLFKFVHELKENISFLDDHSLTAILQRYIDTTADAFNFGVVRSYEAPLVILIFTAICFYFNLKGKIISRKLKVVFSVISIALISYFVWKNGWWKSGMNYNYRACDFYFLMLTIYFITAAVILPMSKKTAGSNSANINEIVLASVLLIVLPVACSFGTYNDLPLHILQYLFAWFALFILLGILLYNSTGLHLFSVGFWCLIACTGMFQTFTGFVLYPYRLPGNLFEQTGTARFLSGAKGLRLDEKTIRHLKTFSDIFKESALFKEGNPIIPVYSSPGIVYLLGGISPSSGWFRNDLPERNCYNILHCNYDLKRTIILKQEKDSVPEKFISCMNQNGIKFPGEYTKIGTIPHNLYDYNIEIFIPKFLMKNSGKFPNTF